MSTRRSRLPISRREPYVEAGELLRSYRRWRSEALGSVRIVEGLEHRLAELTSVRAAVATPSARSALFALLRSLPRDPRRKIAMSAYTFHAVPWLVAATGHVPTFVDPTPSTARPSVERLLDAVDGDTRAVIVTHLFGYPGEAIELRRELEKRDVLVIEDATHALGATLRGKPVGGLGHAAIFSFGMGKLLPAGGGGALMIDDEMISERAVRRELSSSSGQRPWGAHGPLGVMTALAVTRWAMPVVMAPLQRLGGDSLSRILDGLSEEPIVPQGHPDGLPGMGEMGGWTASLITEQLQTLPAKIERLRTRAAMLDSELAAVPGIELPEAGDSSEPVPLYYRIRLRDVPRFRRAALARGLDTQCDDMADCGALFDPSGRRFPNAERLVRQSVEIPLSPRFETATVSRIARVVRAAAAS